MNSPGRLDKIKVSDLKVNCIIGVFPSERQTPQPLTLDLTLYLDTRSAASNSNLSKTVDYARLAGELDFLLQNSHFKLIETAAETICAYIMAPPLEEKMQAQVEAVSVLLKKPEALKGDTVASLEIFRERGELLFPTEKTSFGFVDIIRESKRCGIYRLRINPGKSIETHIHKKTLEAEMPLSNGLLVQNKPATSGTGRTWPLEFAHRYDNPTDVQRTILCIDRPTFDEKDEIPVDLDTLEDLPEEFIKNFYDF